MFVRSRGRRILRDTRGQSIVELAIIAPVLLLFLTIAIDFGRVYLGYINLQNLARIGANFAANDPNASFASGSEYASVILNDSAAINCDLPPAGPTNNVPTPTFIDQNGDGDASDLGDLAQLELSCTFGVITPIISNIVGSQVQVSAAAVFPIKTGQAASGGSAPTVPNPAFSADDTSGTEPFAVQFRDESGGLPTGWFWDFGDGNTSTQQDPVHTYVNAGVYDVSLTVSNSAGSSAPLIKVNYITVAAPGTVAFDADVTSGTSPLIVQFTDQSSDSPTSWLWDFGDGNTSTVQDPSHTFSSAGSYTVTLTVVTPTGGGSLTKTDYITVGVALCTVPDFTGTRRNGAQSLWAGRGFTTLVQNSPGAPNGNFIIGFQSITGNSQVPCDSTIQVNR